MRLKLVHVDIVAVEGKNGKQGYESAEILYDVGGKKQTFKMMSFVNPAGFKLIKDAEKGTELDVTITKNAAGYNQWSDIKLASGDTPAVQSSSKTEAAKPFSGARDFESKEERAHRQVLIVKQSSLSAAIATLTPGAKSALDPAVVIKLAQEYTDFVFGNDKSTEDILSDDFPSDIPY